MTEVPDSGSRPSGLTYRRYTAALSVLLCVIVLASGIVMHRTYSNFLYNNQSENRSLIILGKLEVILNYLIGAETGQRGFIITGDDRYLRPYTTAVAHLDVEIAALEELTRGNPSHVQRLRALKPLIAEKMDGLGERIRIRERRGLQAAILAVQTGKGLIAMEKIRDIISSMQDAERSTLRKSITATMESGRHTLFILIASSSLSLLIVIFANVLSYLEIRKREKTEHALADSELRFRL
ncbi:MAG TPA: CHASE3 domain-containing protein, partial [Thermodesulfovibrionales bacterium]|nr:CHASE3 domain-containing protein [Thermodesulfovibrionales bacterium]